MAAPETLLLAAGVGILGVGVVAEALVVVRLHRTADALDQWSKHLTDLRAGVCSGGIESWPNPVVGAGIKAEEKRLLRMRDLNLWCLVRTPEEIKRMIPEIQEASRNFLTVYEPFRYRVGRMIHFGVSEAWISVGKKALNDEVDKVGRHEASVRADRIGENIAWNPIREAIERASGISPCTLAGGWSNSPEIMKRSHVADIADRAIEIAKRAMDGQVIKDRPGFKDNYFSRALALFELGAVSIQPCPVGPIKEGWEGMVIVDFPVGVRGKHMLASVVAPGDDPTLYVHEWFSPEIVATY